MGQVQQITAPWRDATARHPGRTPPPPAAEEAVPVDPGQERAASSAFQHRDEEMSVRRPEKAVAFENLLGYRTDEIELVREIDPHPVRKLEMRKDTLLPFAFFRFRSRRESKCHRDRESEALTPPEDRCGRKYHGGIPPSGKCDETRRAAQGGPDRLEEGLEG